MSWNDEYPEEDDLKDLREWNAKDFEGCIQFLKEKWCWEDYFSLEDGVAHISTGGWSIHEEMVSALQENFVWWSLYWYSTTRGGHYVFKARNIKEDPNDI